MNRTHIIKKLENRGYYAVEQNAIKNGVEFEGICISKSENETVKPVIYTTEIIRRAKEEGKTIDDVVNTIIDIYEKNKNVDLKVNNFFDRNFILDNLFIGLQKQSNEELVKDDCDLEGIESYLYVRQSKKDSEFYFLKMTKSILDKAGIMESEAWEYAEKNTYDETTITPMVTIMDEIFGIEDVEEKEETLPMYVITNKCKERGASSILNKKALNEIAKKMNTNKVIALPSSIHEMIIIPYNEKESIESYSKLVREVNQNAVEPEIQLTNRAYLLEV